MADNYTKKKPSKKAKSQSAEEYEILQDKIKKVEDWYAYFNEHLRRARDTLTFLYVDQWDVDVRRNRENLSKPCLQFNKLTPIIRSILGEQRENTPALAVRDITTDFKVPQQLVDLRTDLLREISYRSDSDIVYQIALKQMVECGWGAARVITEYENDKGFNQCIRIEPIVDFQAAFFDPLAQEWDKSDGDYAGVYTIMSKDAFERLYPNTPLPQSMVGSNMEYYLPWNTEDAVVVAEMYYKEYFTESIVELSNGKTLKKADADEFMKMQEEDMTSASDDLTMMGYEPVEIVNERVVRSYKIKHCKFIMNAILEETDWAGKMLPIIYAEGDSTIIDGRRIPLPFIQDAVDSQKLYNYTMSEIAYAILRSRREQFMGTQDNFAGHEEIWTNPDQVQGPLIANPDPETKEMPIPIRPSPFPPELLQVTQTTTGDFQQVLGRYEEARGMESNAQSGVAIAERRDASNKPTKVYEDNLARMIKRIGKVILDLIPSVYDTERTVVVRGADNQTRAMTINKQNGYTYNQESDDFEPNIVNDMSIGDYDIEVRVDGSFDQQKAAALEFLIRLAVINPAIANLIPDLIAENSGLENTQKLVERLKTLLPPQILAKEQGLPPPPPPPPPPPDPKIVAAQMKMQTDTMANQLKQQELAQQAAELATSKQLKGLDYMAAFHKALAEIEKSKNAVTQAAIEHASTVASGQHDLAQSNNDLTQKIIESETRRADTAAQMQTLRQMGL